MINCEGIYCLALNKNKGYYELFNCEGGHQVEYETVLAIINGIGELYGDKIHQLAKGMSIKEIEEYILDNGLKLFEISELNGVVVDVNNEEWRKDIPLKAVILKVYLETYYKEWDEEEKKAVLIYNAEFQTKRELSRWNAPVASKRMFDKSKSDWSFHCGVCAKKVFSAENENWWSVKVGNMLREKFCSDSCANDKITQIIIDVKREKYAEQGLNYNKTETCLNVI